METFLGYLHSELPGHANLNAWNGPKMVFVHLGASLVSPSAGEALPPVPATVLGPCGQLLLGHLAAPSHDVVVVLAIGTKPLVVIPKPCEPGGGLADALEMVGTRALVTHNLVAEKAAILVSRR